MVLAPDKLAPMPLAPDKLAPDLSVGSGTFDMSLAPMVPLAPVCFDLLVSSGGEHHAATRPAGAGLLAPGQLAPG